MVGRIDLWLLKELVTTPWKLLHFGGQDMILSQLSRRKHIQQWMMQGNYLKLVGNELYLLNRQMGGEGESRFGISNQGDMTASWSIEFSELNRWPPGLLQVSIGASISEALGVELKWPNDLFFQGKKCGGILLESSNYEE